MNEVKGEFSGKVHWDQTFLKVKTELENYSQDLINTTTNTECLRIYQDAKGAIHRAKGLCLQSDHPLTETWLLTLETHFKELCESTHPADLKITFNELVKTFSLGPEDPNHFNFEKGKLKISEITELKEFARNKFKEISYAEELLQRLDKYKLNLFFHAMGDGYQFKSEEIKLPLNRITELQKLDSKSQDHLYLDIWPNVDSNSVLVKCLILFKDHYPNPSKLLLGTGENP